MQAFLFIWFVLSPVGALFAFGAIPIAIYGLLTRTPHRAVRATRIALVVSLLAVLLSALLWFVLISDLRDHPRDDPIGIYEFVASLEAFALVMALLSALRQRLRRKS